MCIKERIEMYKIEDTALVLVDVQGKLAEIVYKSEDVIHNIVRLIKGLQCLDIPVLWLEQYPKGLGPTHPKIKELLVNQEPIAKMSFSCCDSEAFMEALKQSGKKQLLLAGIETHICMYQTAVDLNEQDYEVQVVADAASSRTKENHELALDRIRDEGVHLTSVEMILFELLRTAEHEQFKNVSKCIK